MATNKVKRSIHLAQPRQILRPKYGLRISPAGSDARKEAQHPRRSPNPNSNQNRRNPNNDPAELAPVKPHVYYAIAELNAGLEKAIHNLQMLQGNHLFGASGLAAMNQVLRGIRARANHELMMALNERETANAGHFQQPWTPSETAGQDVS
jgi:hypothetical protein